MHYFKRLTFGLSIAATLGAASLAWAATITGGPVPLSVRTIEGRVHGTNIMWKDDGRQLVVVNVTENVGTSQVADLFDTLRMQLSRATAIDLRPQGGAGGCCAKISGSGFGYAGNARANLLIEQKLDGADRVVQIVVIRGYSGPAMDAYTAKMLFQ